ncbi:MAG: DUF3891 family protein [Sphingomonadales bacterium]
MIVQSAPAGEPHFVVMMRDHTELAAQFARAFGNDDFEPVEPGSVVIDLVVHHDQGWAEWDAAPRIDPDTRLPYSLSRTPIDVVLKTNVASPDFNERRHPYAGLLSSMHVCGLYNGRFGLTGPALLDRVSAEARPGVNAMLEAEGTRQKRLRAGLSTDPETMPWVRAPHLFQNYKQLQFFDTLALYFNMRHEGERQDTSFSHVPLSADEDVPITISRLGSGTYGLFPYPFNKKPLVASFAGRYMLPLEPDDSRPLSTVLRSIHLDRQSVTLLPGH